MAERKNNTITLPGWLSFGNLITLLATCGAAVGVYAGAVSNSAVQSQKIATIERDQQKLQHEAELYRKELRDDISALRRDIQQLTAAMASKGSK